MTVDEDRALSRADYWDGRYANGQGHEWFRAFKDLESFFSTNLVGTKEFAPEANPLILHLGAGDSVRRFCFLQVHLDLLLTSPAPRPGRTCRTYLSRLCPATMR